MPNVVTLLTPWGDAIKTKHNEFLQNPKKRWGISFAEYNPLLPSLEEVKKLSGKELGELVDQMEEVLVLESKKLWDYTVKEEVFKWIGGLGAIVVSQLKKDELLNEPLKKVMKMEADKAFGYEALDRKIRDSWLKQVPWQQKLSENPALIKKIGAELGGVALGPWIAKQPISLQIKIAKEIVKVPELVVEFFFYYGAQEQELQRRYWTPVNLPEMPKELMGILGPVLQERMVNLKGAEATLFTSHLSRLLGSRMDLTVKWPMDEEAKKKLWAKIEKPKGKKKWEAIILLLGSKELSLAELKTLLASTSLDRSQKEWSNKYARWVWRQITIHPEMTLDAMREEIKQLTQKRALYGRALDWQEMHILAVRWPQLFMEEPLESIVKRMDKNGIRWTAILSRRALKYPESAQIIIENIFKRKNGVSRLLERVEKEPEIISVMPWEYILKHDSIQSAATRFRIQAMAVRGGYVAGSVEGLDPLGNIRSKIQKIRSGHTATDLLIELTKTNGLILQMLEGDLLLKLFKLAGLVSSQWDADTWVRIGQLREMTVAGETRPELLPAALRVFIKPGLKPAAFKEMTHRVRQAWGGRKEESNGFLKLWGTPPVTPSSELPQILAALSVEMRRELVQAADRFEYSTSENLLNLHSVEAKFKALEGVAPGDARLVKINEEEERREKRAKTHKKQEVLFGQTREARQEAVVKWLGENPNIVENRAGHFTGIDHFGRRDGSSLVAQEPKKMRESFEDFLADNPTWFDLIKQYPALWIIMEDVYPLLGHVKMIDEEAGGISKGVKAKDAIGVIVSAWKLMNEFAPDISHVQKLFPDNIAARLDNPRQDWIDIGQNQIESGLLNWLATAKICKVERTDYGRGENDISTSRILASVLGMKDALTPDLMRRMENFGESQIFQIIAAKLGPEAGLSVAHNPGAVLKRLAHQQAREQTNEPKALRELSQRIAESTKTEGLAFPKVTGYENRLQIDTTGSLDILTWNVVKQELQQIADAYTANPEQFKEAESFNRWFELTDEFHRRLRDLDRVKELKQAWERHERFPDFPVEGYRSRNMLIIPMRDNVSLSLEGVLRKHCVGSYSHSCKRGESAIYNVKDAKGETIGTLEMRVGEWRINQFRAFMNRSISQEMYAKAQEIMDGIKDEQNKAERLKEAFAKTEEGMKQKGEKLNVSSEELLMAWLEAGLRGGQGVGELIEGLEKLADPAQMKGFKEMLVARGTQFVRTEKEANALARIKAEIEPTEYLQGIGVDPLRLMIARLEDELLQGKGLKEVLADLQKHLPEEASEYFVHLYQKATEVASTEAQKASIAEALVLLPSLDFERADQRKVGRWNKLTVPRQEKGGKGRSPALVMAYVEEILPQLREAEIKQALGEDEVASPKRTVTRVPKATKTLV